jgi:hypothetical protein
MPALTHLDIDPRIIAWLPTEDATIQKMVAAAREGRGSLNMLLLSTMTTAYYRVAVKEGEEQVCDALRLGSQAACTIFRRASQSSGDVEVQLGPEPKVKLKATGPTGEAHGGNWLNGFFLAAICRDEETLDLLSQVPISVIRSSPSQGEECIYLFIEALQFFLKGEQQTVDALMRALAATDPSKIANPDAKGYVLEVLVPQIDCFYRLLLDNADEFNVALTKGVEWHRKHWTKGKKKKDAGGAYNPGLTAIASLAYDRDMSITVDSPYLPRFLIEGDCVPES